MWIDVLSEYLDNFFKAIGTFCSSKIELSMPLELIMVDPILVNPLELDGREGL